MYGIERWGIVEEGCERERGRKREKTRGKWLELKHQLCLCQGKLEEEEEE